MAALVLTTLVGVTAWLAAEAPTRDRPIGTPSHAGPSPLSEEAFTQRQAAVNRARMPSPQVAAFAAPWLGAVGDCVPEAGSGRESLGQREGSRTRCAAGIVTSYWIAYRSLDDRDRAEARYRAQAATAPDLAPGARSNGQPATHYVEYAYRVPSGPRSGQVVAAIWWSIPDTPVAGVFLAYWTDGLDSSWEPLRALWTRGN